MIFLVKKHLSELLKEHSFEIIKENASQIRFKNFISNIVIGIVIDDLRGNEFEVYVQYGGETYTLQDILIIDMNLVNEIATNFNSSQIAEKSILALKQLLQKENCALLTGTNSVFSLIKKYSLNRANAYNHDLETRQILNKAEVEWKNKDYESLIQTLNLFQQALPPLWKKKYEYAEKHIKKH